MSEHPYIDISHISEYVEDRGPAEYFHGRGKIKNNFKNLIRKSLEKERGGGSTFVIQGAPGAGKTALLYELEKLAKKRGWNVANIGVDALWDPDKLLESFRNGAKYEGTERTTQVGFKGYIMRAWKSIRPNHSVENILRRQVSRTMKVRNLLSEKYCYRISVTLQRESLC